MFISMMADIEGGIRAFFSSLAASLSFNLIFILGILIIAFFAIKSEFAYELRMSRAFDKLNRWLFVNKRLGTNNIKEFSDMIKKCPKRLAYNWQQYILYREKAPSEYMSVENCIDKPLKASSLSANIRNMTLISTFWAIFVFVLGMLSQNKGDTMLNVPVVLLTLLTPLIIVLLYVIAAVSLRARKNSNLDLLYQNHHLFQRFIDNACVDLPTFIDYSLLFTTEEIEKGIPALREYLENRARKEKEEFEKAKREAVVYEQYNFEDAGVDGSNILERAMNESEAYLNKKEKTLAKISQLEASLDSLKKNYINLEKDYQKAMQVSKENIDRLRQQQEETTSRIEGNFLRKQQATEITKQEKIESDFDQQRRKFNIESKDYEDAIKTLQAELDNGKSVAEEAMLSEYQSFYERICKAAHSQMRDNVKAEIANLRNKVEAGEDELAVAQTTLKRLQDENDTLRRKLDLEPAQVAIPHVEEKPEQPVKAKEELPSEIFMFDDEPSAGEEPKVEEKAAEPFMFEDTPAKEEKVEPKAAEPKVEAQVETFKEETKPEMFVFDDAPSEEEPVKTPKPKGRPRKEVQQKPETEKRGRGRPAGSTNKVNSPSMKKRAAAKAKQAEVSGEKRGRGRPPKKKEGEVSQINQKIDEETKKMRNLQESMNSQIEEAIHGLEEAKKQDNMDNLLSQISELKEEAERMKNSTDIDGMNAIEKKIEELLNKIKDINS